MPTGSLRPLFIGLNVGVYFIQVCWGQASHQLGHTSAEFKCKAYEVLEIQLVSTKASSPRDELPCVTAPICARNLIVTDTQRDF
eukprot:348503-Pelagomonas_calceolata.AAC.8